MNGTRQKVLISDIKLRSISPERSHPEELKALAQSWLACPIHDLLVRLADMVCLDGSRRLTGLKMIGETHVEVVLVDGDLSDTDADRIAWVTAYHRAGMGGYEQAVLARNIKQGMGLNNKTLAEELKTDPSDITRLLSLFDCPPDVIEAAKAGKLGKTDWYAIRRSQAKTDALAIKLAGGTRDQLEAHNRAAKDASSESNEFNNPKKTSITITLRGDVTVIIKAKGLTLANSCEYLVTAKQEIERAKTSGLNVKTFERFIKERSTAADVATAAAAAVAAAAKMAEQTA